MYLTLRTLLERGEEDPEVRDARSGILQKGWVPEILKDQKPDGNWESKDDLYRPKYTATFWRMIVLSDFALTYKDDPRLKRGCQLFFDTWLRDMSVFEKHFEVCESGNLAKTLTRFGYDDEARVKTVFRLLVSHQKDDGGWHCWDPDLGTLDCWEALAAFNALPKSKRTRSIQASIDRGAEFYLERRLYREGRKYEPWFRFHYPNHYYYDILIGLDLLTSLGFSDDKRLRPALQILKEKQLPSGLWKLDAIHPDLGKGANYSLKGRKVNKFALERAGKSSKWVTLKALQVLKRVENAD